MSIASNISEFTSRLPESVKLIAVSKTKPVSAIQEAYDAGQRLFGENYVQELIEKEPILPKDIEWHFIGHLQSNKVKYIAPFVHFIHAVDSEKLLAEINKQAAKHQRTIHCLLQLHVAQEETKHGLSPQECLDLVDQIDLSKYPHVSIRGVMGMASFTDDLYQVRSEFQRIYSTFLWIKQKNKFAAFDQISMGMSSDYSIAIEEGSTMVRIGSSLFGSR